MSLGTPSIGTSSLYYSQYETVFVNLLQRLVDNATNDIDAKDVRDAVWTLYNQIQTVASQSLTQSFSYTLATPSTIDVGGIPAGTTFSNISFQDLLDQMFLPYVAPVVTGLTPSSLELEFGSTTGVALSYTIDVGSSPISSTLSFIAPSGVFSSVIPSGTDPEVGTTPFTFTPTYSTSVTLTASNIATMSFTTADALSFDFSTSVIFKHKIYYGPLDLSSLSLNYFWTGPWYNSTYSVATVSAFINDATILGLSYSNLATDFSFSQEMNFIGKHFVYAHPTVFGDLPQGGFYINNNFNTGFVKVRSGETFSNANSYDAPYDVWVSTSPLTFPDLLKINANSE